MMPEPIRRGADPAPPRALRILVVDDSSENRAIVEIYLRALPHQLEFAENGLVAVEKFEVGDFDLVLMDVQMPVMDGHSATRAIRKLEGSLGRPRTPIIAVSASLSEDAGERSLTAGCDLYLAKPLHRSELLEILREHSD
jgi:CheY-like chemotaxis protein